MINNPFHLEEAVAQQKESMRRKLLALVCAVAVTAILLVGYSYIRKNQAQKNLLNAAPPVVLESGPKGPPLAHIVIDEPLLEKGITKIGGAVRNISENELSGLSIALELRRRKDGGLEQTLVPVEPGHLKPQEEGAYSLKLPAQNYGSIRLVGIKANPQSMLIAYSSSPGKKRPPERLEPKTIVVKRAGRQGEFLNSPDNPTRVP
jgi:hypothetical protein